MASTNSELLTVQGAVGEFIARQEAQREFQRVCELANKCFPAVIGLDVMLQEDPDEDGRTQAVVCIKLPEPHPEDQLQAARKRFHERLIAEIPLSHCTTSHLSTEFGFRAESTVEPRKVMFENRDC